MHVSLLSDRTQTWIADEAVVEVWKMLSLVLDISEVSFECYFTRLFPNISFHCRDCCEGKQEKQRLKTKCFCKELHQVESSKRTDELDLAACQIMPKSEIIYQKTGSETLGKTICIIISEHKELSWGVFM